MADSPVTAPETLHLEDLFSLGIIIHASFGNWGAGYTVNPSDLGYSSAEADKIRKGSRPLKLDLADSGDSSKVRATETAALATLAKVGLPFLTLKRTFFVPRAKVAETVAKLESIREDRKQAARAMADALPEIKAKALPVMAEAINALARTPEGAAKVFDLAVASYPAADALADAFPMSWDRAMMASDPDAPAEENAQQVRDTIRSMIERLRDDLAEQLQATMAQARKGGKLRADTIAATRDALSRAFDLNAVIKDPVMGEQIALLSRMMASAEGADGASLLPSFETAQRAISRDVESATASALSALSASGKRRIG